MNILCINKFYHTIGGTSRYFYELSKLLGKNGHNVALFSMLDSKNAKTKWSKYFVSNISFDEIYFRNGLRIISRMLYSREARKKISNLLDVFKPDIAHVINIYHQISPSILLELKKKNIPIVHTVGDYHLISPHHNNLFHDGKICEVSKINRFYNTIIHKCIKNSYFASFAEALEQYYHHLFRFYRNTIDYYISPSTFLTEKLVEYNIPKDKIIQLPYFIDTIKYDPVYNGDDYILYFGRLSSEKGLLFLIEVMRYLPSIKLIIVGMGQESDKLKELIRQYNLDNIDLMSKFIPETKLKKLISQSRFTIFPSQSFEIFGLSVLEAFASGKPVVTSRIGALPEIVKNNFNGFLFEPGNVDDCREKILKLWNNPSLCKKMGRNAMNYVEKNFGPEEHYKRIMNIYKSAICKHRVI